MILRQKMIYVHVLSVSAMFRISSKKLKKCFSLVVRCQLKLLPEN